MIYKLLQELRSCGIGQNTEEIEVFKDDKFSYASMIGHLRMLMKLNRLNEDSINILRNLSLLPVSGVYKSAFKMWLELDSLKNVNELIRYGIISEDTENKTIALHPLIQEVAIAETIPTVSDCHVMLNHLHLICLAHGLDVKRPVTVMEEAVSELKTAFTVRREYASCPGRYNDSFFFNLTAPDLDNTSATN